MNAFIAAVFGTTAVLAAFGLTLSFGDWAYTKYLTYKQRKEEDYEND